MDTLTIEYRNKVDGLTYIRFDADQVPNEEKIWGDRESAALDCNRVKDD